MATSYLGTAPLSVQMGCVLRWPHSPLSPVGSFCGLSQPGWPAEDKAAPSRTPWAAQSLGIFTSSISHKYLAGNNLITRYQFDSRQPTLPSTHTVLGKNCDLLGLEMNRWSLSLPTLAENQTRQRSSSA